MSSGARGSFNEAAAYHCGKRGDPVGELGVSRASMRPQHITAENPSPVIKLADWWWCFNEAAAYHCGKRSP